MAYLLTAFLVVFMSFTPGMTFANSGSVSTAKLQQGPKPKPPKLGPRTKQNLVQYVDPFIGSGVGASDYGTGGGGANLFPGADVPFGMVQWSPDTNPHTQGGYKYGDKTIQGFSLTHMSGAGCSAYGDIPFMPIVGSVKTSPATSPGDYKVGFSHDNEQASPGYYQVKLDSGVNTQLTVTQRSGFGEFTYPSAKPAAMLIKTSGSSNGVSASTVRVVGNNEVVGSATSGHFCGSPAVHTIYFAAQFNQPFQSTGTWSGSGVHPGSTASKGTKSGAYVTFDTSKNQTVQMKVGVSYVSTQNAKENLMKEDPGWNFDQTKKQASETWNRLLNRIQVGGGTAKQKKIFYTALYHSLLQPNVFSDDNGQYIGFDGKIHETKGHAQYANFSGWDVYRSKFQLISLVAPQQTSDMVQSLINDAKQGGSLPKWPVANGYANIMVGDPADAMIAEANAFGADHFDKKAALKYMLKGATQPGANSSGYVERPGLEQYMKDGYVSNVATTLEYTSADFSIARFAKSLGDRNTYQKFMKRAQNWQNLFNPGNDLIQPKQPNGAFLEHFSPEKRTHYIESNAYQYVWMVPYNLRGLFNAMGGNDVVVKKLDHFFTKLNAGADNTEYAFLGNEPSLETPWEYDFAGAPWRTQDVVRRAITTLYNATPGGLAGNDDLGEMSSWYVWGAMGLFPEIPGVGGFTIGSPLFSNIKIHLADGHQLHIVAPKASKDTPYVQKLKLNGKSYNSTWLPLNKIMTGHGANLHFWLGKKPNKNWASDPKAAPPSFTAGEAPALGFTSQSKMIVKPGSSATFQFGIQNVASQSVDVNWTASAPKGLKLSPSSGEMKVNVSGSKTTGVTVKVPANAAEGTYTIPIQLHTGSGQLPTVYIQVVIAKPGQIFPYFNNAGISSDSNPGAANCDGLGWSYSAQALQKAGITPGGTITHDGMAFKWPDQPLGSPDNIISDGQTIPLDISGTKLGFLGSATNGPSVGTGTIQYADGTVQKFQLGFSDWTLNAGGANPEYGNEIIASMPYRNGGSGKQMIETDIFYVPVSLKSGKTVKSVTLPDSSSINQGSIHIFAIGVAQ